MGYENALAPALGSPRQLSLFERTELQRHEATIERGLQTFVEVGNALASIRDGKLYRETHGTFEDYCRDRWGFTDRRARMLIDAAKTIANIETGTIVPLLPATESQARPLTRLEPDAQAAAWREAVETAPNGKVTAAHVQSVVDRMVSPEVTKPQDIGPVEAIEVVATRNKLAVHHSSETPEHYTPSDVLQAVRECLGEIDLDPCADPGKRVPALNHFTKDDDGLSRPWFGRVYMNPPYGRTVADWVGYLVGQYEHGDVTEAIVLLPARPDTQWWKMLRDFPVCFVEGRLTFIGNDDPAPFPSALFYIGQEIDKFYHHFVDFGDVWQRIEPGMFGE